MTECVMFSIWSNPPCPPGCRRGCWSPPWTPRSQTVWIRTSWLVPRVATLIFSLTRFRRWGSSSCSSLFPCQEGHTCIHFVWPRNCVMCLWSSLKRHQLRTPNHHDHHRYQNHHQQTKDAKLKRPRLDNLSQRQSHSKWRWGRPRIWVFNIIDHYL